MGGWGSSIWEMCERKTVSVSLTHLRLITRCPSRTCAPTKSTHLYPPTHLPTQVYPHEYDLILRPDINTRGHTQWFFFRMANVRKVNQSFLSDYI